MYDYDAQDEDEVGFHDGDMIIDVEPIDEGWMFGTVQSSGKRGMLPANYVERVKWTRALWQISSLYDMIGGAGSFDKYIMYINSD